MRCSLLSPRSNLAAVFAWLLLAAFSHAQAAPESDVSFQYSHLFVTSGPKVNIYGASCSGSYNFDEWLGFVGDIGLYHRPQTGSNLTGITYMFGTRISYRKLERVVPFIQGLAGGSHFSSRLGGASGSINPFSYAFGAGVDITLGRSGKVALRPQVEYIGFRYITDGARVSIGIAYRIGRRTE